jgi:hypothetical protein
VSVPRSTNSSRRPLVWRLGRAAEGTLREHRPGHARPPRVTPLQAIPSSCEAFVPASCRTYPRFPPGCSMVRRGSTVRVRQRALQSSCKSASSSALVVATTGDEGRTPPRLSANSGSQRAKNPCRWVSSPRSPRRPGCEVRRGSRGPHRICEPGCPRSALSGRVEFGAMPDELFLSTAVVRRTLRTWRRRTTRPPRTAPR